MKTKLKDCRGRIIHYSPADVLENVRRHPLGIGFHVVCLGWFPGARGHGIERPRGLDECIMIFCTRGKGWLETDGPRVVVGAGEARPPRTHGPIMSQFLKMRAQLMSMRR